MKKQLILLVIVLWFYPASAQWTLLSNDYVANTSLASFDPFVISGISFPSDDFNLAVSEDSGDQWSGIQIGSSGVSHLLMHGLYFYAATPNGVFRSPTDNLAWELYSTGLSGNVTKTCGSNGLLFALAGNKVYSRSEEDDSWVIISEPDLVDAIYDIDFDGSLLLIAGYDGVAESIDLGLNWTKWPHAQYGFRFDAVKIKGDTIVAASASGIYRKLLQTGSISLVSAGLIELWSPYGDYYGTFNQFYQVGKTLFVGGETGVYKLSDNIWYWEHTGCDYTWALTDNGTTLFAATGYGGIWGRPLEQLIVHLPQDLRATPLPLIFPNPVRFRLTVSVPVPETGNTCITIFNQEGIQMIIQQAIEQEFEVDVESWKPGLYFVTLSNFSGAYTAKFLKLAGN